MTINVCGTCGKEHKCIKTGMTIYNDRYHPCSRFASDFFACPFCGVFVIRQNESDYLLCEKHNESDFSDVDCFITETNVFYTKAFVNKLKEINPTLTKLIDTLPIKS
jgi:hypothetical protein